MLNRFSFFQCPKCLKQTFFKTNYIGMLKCAICGYFKFYNGSVFEHPKFKL